MSKVLLATLATSFSPADYGIVITADIVWTMFTPYGTVEKIVLIQKDATTNMQALIQYHDQIGCANAFTYLHNKVVYVATEPPVDITIYLQYSHLPELTVRTQSIKARDYTLAGTIMPAVNPAPNPPTAITTANTAAAIAAAPAMITAVRPPAAVTSAAAAPAPFQAMHTVMPVMQPQRPPTMMTAASHTIPAMRATGMTMTPQPMMIPATAAQPQMMGYMTAPIANGTAATATVAVPTAAAAAMMPGMGGMAGMTGMMPAFMDPNAAAAAAAAAAAYQMYYQAAATAGMPQMMMAAAGMMPAAGMAGMMPPAGMAGMMPGMPGMMPTNAAMATAANPFMLAPTTAAAANTAVAAHTQQPK